MVVIQTLEQFINRPSGVFCSAQREVVSFGNTIQRIECKRPSTQSDMKFRTGHRCWSDIDTELWSLTLVYGYRDIVHSWLCPEWKEESVQSIYRTTGGGVAKATSSHPHKISHTSQADPICGSSGLDPWGSGARENERKANWRKMTLRRD